MWKARGCIRCLPQLLFDFFFLLSLRGSTWCHGRSLEIRGQLAGVSSLLPLCSSGDQTQVAKLNGKHLYQLSHLTGSLIELEPSQLARLVGPWTSRHSLPQPGVEAHSFNLSTQEARWMDLCAWGPELVPKIATSTWWDPVSNKTPPACLCLPGTGIQVCSFTSSPHCCLSSELRSSCLPGQHFTHWSIP